MATYWNFGNSIANCQRQQLQQLYLAVGYQSVGVTVLLQQVPENIRVARAGRQTDRHLVVDRFELRSGAGLDQQLDDRQVPGLGGPV